MTTLDHPHLAPLVGALSTLGGCLDEVAAMGRDLYARLDAGHRLLAVGNGGSAAQAQHLTAELVGRYREDRPPYSAICLSAETSSLTAIANDYPPEELFARQVAAHGRPGDVLVVPLDERQQPQRRRGGPARRGLGSGRLGHHRRGAQPAVARRAPHARRRQPQHGDGAGGAPRPAAPAVRALRRGLLRRDGSAGDRPMSRIVVVGEAMLDVDLEGTAHRLSPEAPVPVLDDLSERRRPGGAALAAAMAAADGHEVVLVTPWAGDEAAGRLREVLTERVEVVPLPAHGGTPVKRRVRADGHNLVRLDEGGGAAPCGDLGPVERALAGADAVLVADYGRGLTRDEGLRALLLEAGRRVPLVWDPHPRGAPPVGSTLVMTPNAAELEGIVDEDCDATGSAVREAAVRAACATRRLGVRAVAVTLGSRGALLSFGDGPPEVFAARAVTGDPCGAGDRFASTVASALASGFLLSEAVGRAVGAATEHVALGGAAAFGRSDPEPEAPLDALALAEATRARGGTVVATGGCFDLLHAGHVAMLESARALGDRLVVLLNSDDSVRRLKGEGRPIVSAPDRARVLLSLACVDAVLVFDEDTPSEAIEALRPDVWVKGGDYAGRRLPEEEVLGRWGGQAVVVPYLRGRSTSAMVSAMATERPTAKETS
ncbi:PfkB family carbohydrate kinase [Aeromicrobium sp. 179-A 4D2 NHS]|uniref:PfkB family carbohydrate kinase n=1 Tax=Aeromicrobium sp. 179-A 4D2 NHS TaxID=3142375 RepID=UPI00399F35A9